MVTGYLVGTQIKVYIDLYIAGLSQQRLLIPPIYTSQINKRQPDIFMEAHEWALKHPRHDLLGI